MNEPGPSAPEYGEQPGPGRYAYHILAGAAVLVLVLGTVGFHYLEGWSWVDSFYFSTVAGTTVGFGDLAPTTDVAKLFSVVYIFFAIGILGTFVELRLRYHGVVRKRTEAVMSRATRGDQN